MPDNMHFLTAGTNVVRIPKPNEYCFCGSVKKYKKCCMGTLVRNIGGGPKMLLQEIGGVCIYRPRIESNQRFRRVAEAHLREKFAPGIYKDFDTVDAILKWQISLFAARFDEAIPKLASRSFMDFLMFQYEESGRLDSLEKSGVLKGAAANVWLDLGRTYKRTLKHIAERSTMLATESEPSVANEERLNLIDDVFIFGEELVGYCILSDQARLFKSTTQIVIQPPGQDTFLDHSIADARFESFGERIAAHRANAGSVYEQTPYQSDIRAHAKQLDEVFVADLGVSYLEAISILHKLYEGARPNSEKNNFQTVFVLKDAVIEKLSRAFLKSPESIERVLSGFVLTKEDMLREGKDYWNPQFHYRAYRRGILSLPHTTGPHLAWSKCLYLEGLTVLINEVSFGQFPKEWRSPEINSKLGDIVRERGAWFESQVQKNLLDVGIPGLISRTSLGRGRFAFSIPTGELDFIGWWPVSKSLVLLECKMLQEGTEPRMWKNQIDLFTKGSKADKSFVSKLALKANWIAENQQVVSDALRSEGILLDGDEPTTLCAGFVTYSPNAASYFVDDFPCVSLPEIVAALRTQNKWPFETGKYWLTTQL